MAQTHDASKRPFENPETMKSIKQWTADSWKESHDNFTRRYDGVINLEEHSSRLLNHWTEEEVLDETREDGRGRRHYNILELVWIHIITELRTLGYSIEFLRALREYVLDHRIAEFAFFISRVLEQKEEVSIAVFVDGTAWFAFTDEYADAVVGRNLGSHIHIDLNAVVKKLLPQIPLGSPEPNTPSFSSEEIELIMTLRAGKFKEVRITSKNGKMDAVSIEEYRNGNHKLNEILAEGSYQNIEFIQKDSKVRFVRVTKHKKV